MFNIIGLILIYSFILVTPIHAEENKESVSMAILPCTDIVMTFKKFHPLISYLKERTGLNIKIVVPEDFTNFERSINNGEIDFVFQDPHTFLKLQHLLDQSSHLRSLNKEGGTTQSGVVVVRKDSGMSQLTDLKGKTVMFGPKFSTSKWVAAKLLFEESNIGLKKDLHAYFNGGCCEDIAFSVYLKAVDAGVVCEHFKGEHEKKQKELGIDASEIITIAETKSVPMKVFSARKGVLKDVIYNMKQLLLELDKNNPEHAKVLFPAELGGFEKFTDGDCESIKMMMNSSNAE